VRLFCIKLGLAQLIAICDLTLIDFEVLPCSAWHRGDCKHMYFFLLAQFLSIHPPLFFFYRFMQVALSHYCDPLGNISFYRGQVMTINTAAISPTSSRHSLTPILQPKVQEQQQQRTQHSIPNGKNAAVAAAAAAAAVQMPCGLGVQLVKTGHRSSGCFVRGLQHGHGVQRHPNGSVAYAGEYMVCVCFFCSLFGFVLRFLYVFVHFSWKNGYAIIQTL